MRFTARALNADHLIETLTLEALDLADAQRQLQLRQLTPLQIAPAQALATRRQRFSLTLFSQELLALLEAGLSLVESLEALLDKEGDATARQVLSRLLADLRDGLRFSAALSRQTDAFPALYIGIVQAAEGTSELPRALQRYLDYQLRLEEVCGRIISAAIYPCILILVGGTVALFLLGYVVPRFAVVYQGSGRSLPFLSQLLLSWGQFLAQHTMLVIGTLCGSLALLIWQVRRMVQSGRWLHYMLSLPGLGERVRILELSRLYLTLGMLLEGGIPILHALNMVSGILSPHTGERLAAAAREIGEGQALSDAFERHALTTAISLRMLRVGERSGQLGNMLTRSALFYEGETARWVERFSKTFEPILMAGIGLVIGLIVVLLYMPIFDLAGNLR